MFVKSWSVSGDADFPPTEENGPGPAVAGFIQILPDGTVDADVLAHDPWAPLYRASSATAQCADTNGDGSNDQLLALTIAFESVVGQPRRAEAEFRVTGLVDESGAFEAMVFWNGAFAGDGRIRGVGRNRRGD